MRQRARFIGAVAMCGVFAVGGLGACGLAVGSTFEDDHVLSEEITSVRLDNRSGGVTLRGQEDVTEVSIHRSIEYWGERPEGATHQVDNGVLVLGDCGQRCSVSYTVDLPTGLPVKGETSAGAISLSNVGEVQVNTSSGDINLDGVADAVDVQTSNGQITGRGLEGERIQAQTSNGAIDLTPATPQDVRAETSNGDITITVPAGQYQVSAQTSNGSKDIRIPRDPDGAYQLDLTTSNGDITVESA